MPSDYVGVSETNATILVDGTLNITAEWNGSSVVSWVNPLNGEEYDTVYLLHNSTHYLFGAILYDPDTVRDDSLTLYVKWDNITYKYVIEEDSSVIELYNLTDGQVTLSSNGTALMTRSSPSTPWLYLEMVLPKDEWDSATTVRILFEHRHTFKIDTLSRYPEGADPSDPSTWLEVEYRKVLGQYKVVLSFVDRDGNSIEYVFDKGYVVISFLNGTEYLVQSLSGSSLIAYLPPENYTITFYVYGIVIFNTTIEVNDNITASYTLKNLKHVSIAMGDVVAIVGLPGEIGSIYLEPEKQLGMLISNSTKPIALRVYPTVIWNYTFVVVLNAFNFTYNPFTGSLLAYVPANFSGIMMIGAPAGYPTFFFANGTVKGYVYNHELEELGAWVLNGTFEVFNSKKPFAITLNNTALKRGQDYSVDPLNVTRIVVGTGELRIYYKNPAEVEMEVLNDTARVIIATPYRFNGKVLLTIRGSSTTTKTVTFTSTPPLTIVDLSLNLEPGSYTIEAVVTDEDSQQTIGKVSASYKVEGAPALVPISWEYYIILIVRIVLAVALILAIRTTSKAVIVELEKKRKFVKKKR